MQQTGEKEKTKSDLKLSFNSKKEWWMAKDMDTARGPGNYPKLKVDEDEVGEFTFTIHQPKEGITFAQTDAFVPKAGANPPDFADQFTVTGEGTNRLIVTDANANKGNSLQYPGGEYVYELRFSNGTTLDPIITNGGCCQSGNYMVYYALGGVALIALFILVIRPMLARRSSPAMRDRDRS